ncbi:hypothetical protein D3C87_98810 [compost metagenome]
MKKELQFHKIIENIIEEINSCKKSAESIYQAGDIKSSGMEVEDLIRNKISAFLPERYLVKQGHIVNPEGKVSPQLDVIIFDRLNTPKFFESRDNTVFYPIESVLAVGEIKKTLRKNDVIEFGEKIKFIKQDMGRRLVESTVFEGIKGSTSIRDAMNMSIDQKYKNPLFSFIFALDHENPNNPNFALSDTGQFMPNDIYVLNTGYYLFGTVTDKSIQGVLEDEHGNFDELLEIKKPGIHVLSTLLFQLIKHLNRCYIEPFSIANYIMDEKVYAIEKENFKLYTIKKT